MTMTELRRRVKRQIESLPADRLKAAADFVDYLTERKPNAATRELLRIPNLLKDIQTAEKHIARGRHRDWRKVRRDV
jgi:hypothetical protein